MIKKSFLCNKDEILLFSKAMSIPIQNKTRVDQNNMLNFYYFSSAFDEI